MKTLLRHSNFGVAVLFGFAAIAALTVQAAPTDDTAMLQKAQKLEQQAIEEHSAWNTTEQVLAQAVALKQKGDHAGAASMAARAAELAQLSLDQARQQRRDWKNAVVN